MTDALASIEAQAAAAKAALADLAAASASGAAPAVTGAAGTADAEALAAANEQVGASAQAAATFLSDEATAEEAAAISAANLAAATGAAAAAQEALAGTEAVVATENVATAATGATAAVSGLAVAAGGLKSAQAAFKDLNAGVADLSPTFRGVTSDLTGFIRPLSRLPLGGFKQIASEATGAGMEINRVGQAIDKINSGSGTGIGALFGSAADAEASTVALDANTTAAVNNAAARVQQATAQAAVAAAQQALNAGMTEGEAAVQAALVAQDAYTAALAQETTALTAAAIAQQALTDEVAAGGLADQATTVDTMTKSLTDLGLAGSNAGAQLGTLADITPGAIGVIAGAGIAAAAGAVEFDKLGNSLYNFQAISGATAEQASLLVGEANLLGISSTTLGTAIGRLGANIEKGTVDLGAYGVQVATTKDGTVDLAGTFDNIAQKFSTTTDATAKAALAQQAFGRGWMTLAPLLEQGSAGLQKLQDQVKAAGLVMDQASINQAHDFSESLRTVTADVKGLLLPIGQDLVGAIEAVVGPLEAADQGFHKLDSDMQGLASHIPGGSSALSGFGKIIGDVTNPLKALGDIESKGSELVDMLGGSYRNAAQKQTDYANATNATVAALLASVQSGQVAAGAAADLSGNIASLNTNQLAEIDAAEKVDTAEKKLTDDLGKHKDAVTILNDQLAVQKARLDAVTTSEQNMLDAVTGLPAALAAEQDAIAAVATAQGNQAQAAQDVIDANQTIRVDEGNLALQHDKVAQAADTVAKAEAALAKAKQESAVDTVKLQQAEESLAQAHINGEKAALSLKDAQERLNIDRAGAASPDQLAKDEIALQQAQLDGSKATTDAAKAQSDLNDARSGAQRAQDIQTAEDNLTTALDNQKQANIDLQTKTDDLANAQFAAKQKADAVTKSNNDLASAYQNVATAADKVAEEQAKAAGDSAATVQAKAQAEVNAFKDVEKAYPALASTIDKFISGIAGIPGVNVVVGTTINPQGGVGTTPYGPGVPQTGPDVLPSGKRIPYAGEYATGGVVSGPTGAEAVIVAHGGEVVFNPKEGFPADAFAGLPAKTAATLGASGIAALADLANKPTQVIINDYSQTVTMPYATITTNDPAGLAHAATRRANLTPM